MAPEQAAADPHTDHRADIYAVGALAYEMLCGQPPFTGATPQEVMAAHVSKAAEPISERRQAVSDALNVVVMRCLEKRAADRWQSAAELVPQLKAMATPSGGITPTGTQPATAVNAEMAARQAQPVRVAGLFGLASIGVLAIVYALVHAIGLPDWVFVGAIGLLSVGLPIMLLTGHHERRRSVARTTGLVVPTPTSGAWRWFTWRRSLIGGGLAFAALAGVTTTYMAMRLLGIGPVGTLVAAGTLEERDRLIVADFEDRASDADLGTSVTEALRIDLSQSPVVRVMDAAEIGDVLRRMSHDPGSPLDAELAREIAEREGLKAVVTGDVGRLGSAYVVSARLLATTDGSALVALRETADDAADIINAVDRLSAKLRERIGESFRTIRSTPALGRVSTRSLTALRKYSQAIRADQNGEIEQAVLLLEEAIAEDTTFAMAYRALAEVLWSVGTEPARVIDGATKAFEYRDNLPPVERYLAEGFYYTRVELERSRAATAYRSALEMRPDDVAALSELAGIAMSTRHWAEAESLALQAIPLSTGWQAHTYAARALMAQGKVAEARATVDDFANKAPASPDVVSLRWRIAAAARDYDSAETYLEALERFSDDYFWEVYVNLARGSLHQVRGELRAAQQALERQRAPSAARGNVNDYLLIAEQLGYLELLMRERPATAIAIADEAISRFPLDSISEVFGPYLGLAALYADAGSTDKANTLLEEYDRLAPMEETALRARQYASPAAVARAERRFPEAIAGYRTAHEEGANTSTWLFELAHTYDVSGNVDSAIALFERALGANGLERILEEYWALGHAYRRLGQLYEERGERDKALQYHSNFVELWKDADEELQPVVEDVRGRIARLVGER
jgi:tetratricopeptide (TPR) repeat protein